MHTLYSAICDVCKQYSTIWDANDRALLVKIPQVELPGPRVYRHVNASKSDLELFKEYVAPSGGLLLIGDTWDDVTRN